MNRIVKDCDSCKKEIQSEPVSISLPTGRVCSREEWKGNGPPNAVFTDLDFCSACAAKHLERLVRNLVTLPVRSYELEFEEINKWIAKVKQ